MAQLKSFGHQVTALDLAASGINPKTVEDVHSYADYAEPLMTFMEALPSDERIILVGHSQGGGCIALAMEKYPQKIAVGVFVASLMPCLGFDMESIYKKYERPVEFYMDNTFTLGENNQPLSVLFGPEYMRVIVFQLCPPEDLELASVLIRPMPVSADPSYLEKDPNALTEQNYGSLPRIYIKLEDDKVINRPVEEFRLKNYPPKELKIIHNADHMVMLSNPHDLSSYFQEISQKYD